MASYDHEDTPDIDYGALATLPRNPFAQKVTPPPDFVSLVGEHFASGLAGSSEFNDQREALATETGFETPVAPEYNQEVTLDVPQPAAQSQGSVALPIAHEVLRGIAAKWNLGALYWQWEQANKQPSDFNTRQGIVVGNTAEAIQIGSRNPHRAELIISNTGTHPVFIASTINDAPDNGFTLAAGGVLTIESRGPVFAYCPSGTTSTLDTLETTYAPMGGPSVALAELGKEQASHGF